MTIATNITLDTPRLLLRPLNDKDAHDLFKIMSDVDVMRYWKSEPWKCMERAYKAIDDTTKAMKTGNQLTLGLIRKSDSQLIGTCLLSNITKSAKRAELGYGLATNAWNKGYMREALYEFLDLAFGKLHLNRVEAEIDPRDTSSAKTLERLGFDKNGYLKQRWIIHGEHCDSEIYGLLAEEWSVKQKQNKKS